MPKWGQLLWKSRPQGPGPLRNREDQYGFPPHQPNWYSTLEEKYHQLEGASSPCSIPVRKLTQSSRKRLREKMKGKWWG